MSIIIIILFPFAFTPWPFLPFVFLTTLSTSSLLLFVLYFNKKRYKLKRTKGI